MIPPRVTGSNGEPVATIARPSVHANASSGVISACEVGFESGKIIGRSCEAAIERMTASEIVPLRPERPRISWGFSRSTCMHACEAEDQLGLLAVHLLANVLSAC